MPYRYSMLRFVPDPARGEFVNIGAIAGDDEAGDWEFRQIQNLRRAKSIDDNMHARLPQALAFIAEIENRIDALDQLQGLGPEPMSGALLRLWAAEMRNVIQLSPPTPILAESAAAALDLVFSELVVDEAAKHYSFQKKSTAVARTRQAYRENSVPNEAVSERSSIVAGPYDGQFDFTVRNSHVVQLVQVGRSSSRTKTSWLSR